MKYAIVTEESLYSEIFEVMFSDVLADGKSEIISQYLIENNEIRKKIFNILYKNKVNNILNGYFEPILKPKYSLEEFLKKNNNEECTVIFMNSSLQKFYTEKSLKRIKNKYSNVKYVLLFVDAVFQKQAQRAFKLIESNVFDLVYTFDKSDAQEYNFLYINTPYSKIDSVEIDSKYNGVYFCGSDKGRVEFLDEIATQLKNLKIDYRFDVYSKTKSNKEYNFKLKYDDYKKYSEILKDTLEYSCILDIVQSGREEDTGLSLRVYEATVYNKILITNNINIMNYEFYNPKYMHYIKDSSDIKAEWFNDKPEYNYSGQLSPKLFINHIENKLKGCINER